MMCDVMMFSSNATSFCMQMHLYAKHFIKEKSHLLLTEPQRDLYGFIVFGNLQVVLTSLLLSVITSI